MSIFIEANERISSTDRGLKGLDVWIFKSGSALRICNRGRAPHRRQLPKAARPSMSGIDGRLFVHATRLPLFA